MTYDFRDIINTAIGYFEGQDPYEKIIASHSTYIAVWGQKPEGIITEILHNKVLNSVTIATFNQDPETETRFKEHLEKKGGLEVRLEVNKKPDIDFPQPAFI